MGVWTLKGMTFNHSEETKEKIKRNNAKYWLGKKRPSSSETTRRKISESLKIAYANGLRKRECSKDTKKKISKSLKGFKWPERTEEHRKNLSDSLKRRFSDPTKHPSWKGGKSFEPYPIIWTSALRRVVRERDNHICQICKESEEARVLDVHHIDYDKNNCSLKNLIALCRNCHVKTNFKRKYWIKYFSELKN